MKTIHACLLLTLFIAAAPGLVRAQVADDYHPILTNTFQVSAGAFIPDKSFEIRVDGSVPGESIDFDEVFKTGDSETTGGIDFKWRFGEKWSLQGQYWRVSDSGSSTLEEDVKWQDVTFLRGTQVGAGADFDVARVFFGRRFGSGPQHEWGLGAGLHWLEISAYAEGQILTDMGDSEFYRGSVSAGAPLPNIGAWYTWSWSPRWALLTRVDWLSVSFDEFSGSLLNTSVGVNWAFSTHFGLSAFWNYFSLDVDVDNSDWRGAAKIAQNGPLIALTATW